MRTDWKLVRELMMAVIDSCERIESAGYAEADRDRTVEVSGIRVSLHEFMVSAWTLPRTLRYQIIRDRHDEGRDAAYAPDAARMIVRMAEACAELVGAGDTRSAEARARAAIGWYRDHAVPHILRAMLADRHET